ncbi:MAG: hypothetical protein ACYTBS_24375 [Planctomycetota bacterium]
MKRRDHASYPKYTTIKMPAVAAKTTGPDSPSMILDIYTLLLMEFRLVPDFLRSGQIFQ